MNLRGWTGFAVSLNTRESAFPCASATSATRSADRMNRGVDECDCYEDAANDGAAEEGDSASAAEAAASTAVGTATAASVTDADPFA